MENSTRLVRKILFIIISGLALLIPPILNLNLGTCKGFYEFADLFAKSLTGSFSEYFLSDASFYTFLYKMICWLVFPLGISSTVLYILDTLFLIGLVIVVFWIQKEKILKYKFYILPLMYLCYIVLLFSSPSLFFNYKILLLSILLCLYADRIKNKMLGRVVQGICLICGFSLPMVVPFLWMFFRKKDIYNFVLSVLVFAVQMVMIVFTKTNLSVNTVLHLLSLAFLSGRFLDVRILVYLTILLSVVMLILTVCLLVISVRKKKDFIGVFVLTNLLYVCCNFIWNGNTINQKMLSFSWIISAIVLIPEVITLFMEYPRWNLFNNELPFTFSVGKFLIFVWGILLIYSGACIFTGDNKKLNSATISCVSDLVQEQDFLTQENKDSFRKYYLYQRQHCPMGYPYGQKNKKDLVTFLGGFYPYDPGNKAYWTTENFEALVYAYEQDKVIIELGCPEALVGKKYQVYIDSQWIEERILTENTILIYDLSRGYSLIRLIADAQNYGEDVRPIGLMIKEVRSLVGNRIKENFWESIMGVEYDENTYATWIYQKSKFIVHITKPAKLTLDVISLEGFIGKEIEIYVNSVLDKKTKIASVLEIDLPQGGIYILDFKTEATYTSGDIRPLGFAVSNISLH